MTGNPLMLVTAALIVANLGLAIWLLIRRDARWAMVLWTATLFFTPVYLSFGVAGVTLTILDVTTILVLVSCLPGARLRWSVIDSLMVIVLICMFAGLLFGAVRGHMQEVVLSWVLPYAWGRVVVARVGMDWIATCIGVAAVAASMLAIVEFATGVNIFVLIPGVAGAQWTQLQYRGGLLRAEGAFGHSISLGSSLAISAAFVLAARWKTLWKSLALAVVITGIVVTFSRIGLVGLSLVLGFSLLFLGHYIRRVQRLVVFGLALVGMAVALPFITVVFDDAGQEASGSADYRGDLLSLLDDMALIGISPAREVSPRGIDYYGGYRSIDSALILTGLRHGMIPLLLFLVMLAICAWVVLSGRGNPAAVAVLSQVPALATVALITQYAQFIWFAAGLAVASYSLDSRRDSSRRDRAQDEGQRGNGDSIAERIDATSARALPVLVGDRARRGSGGSARFRLQLLAHAHLPLQRIGVLLPEVRVQRIRHQPGFRVHAESDAVVRAAGDLGARPRRGERRAV